MGFPLPAIPQKKRAGRIAPPAPFGSMLQDDQDLQLWLPLPGSVIVIEDLLPSSE